jgi:general nucleoside transport system ATP-binding protein
MRVGEPGLVEVRSVSKSFGLVHALDSVSLTVRPGTFHAVIGENGAGKSTLAKCVLGFYTPNAGEVRVNETRITNTVEARSSGIGMVFQQFTLIPSMTVAENLLLARKDLPALIHWREEHARLQKFLETAPFSIDLQSRIAHLSAGQKQKVEILKQLYLDAKILILDEPTSVLTPDESDEVMGVLSRMVQRGTLSVILITHRLREVMDYADEVTVLRGGRIVTSQSVAKSDAAKLAELMMGESRLPEVVNKRNIPSSTLALDIMGLTVRGDNGLVAVNQVSLNVRRGEILGVAGVSGNGQRELVQAIAGQRTIESGKIRAFDKPFHPTCQGIRTAGLFTLPEEALENATVPSMTVAENLALRKFDRAPFSKMRWLLNRSAIRDAASIVIKNFSIRPPFPEIPIRNLSGGNVQRAVLGRDLMDGEARILVVANPCHGLDFVATAFVHNHLVELRNNGGALLVVSEDLDELVKLADRIVVMSGGAIAHETRPAELDRALLGRYIGGTVGSSGKELLETGLS